MGELTKLLGLSLGDASLMEEHYESLRGIMIHKLSNMGGYVMDLDSLPREPIDLKGAVIKWLVAVNMPRIVKGDEPIITMQLLLKCPVWKIVPPPIKQVMLSKQGLMNKPSVKTQNQLAKPGSINKGK